MPILEYFDKNNLHHAYLIEGAREEVLKEVQKFLDEIEVSRIQNPDYLEMALDSFKIEDARNLKSYGGERGVSNGKRIFVISTNSFLLEAQNSLLKMFEEPIPNTHFFLIVPDANVLLPTFVSRFYLIRTRQDLVHSDAEKFIKLSHQDRIEFIKSLLTEEEGNEEENLALDSARSKAINFLNKLEFILNRKLQENSAALPLPGIPGGTYADRNFPVACFEHFFKVREFLRMPGSSTKSLMESVALIVPNF